MVGVRRRCQEQTRSRNAGSLLPRDTVEGLISMVGVRGRCQEQTRSGNAGSLLPRDTVDGLVSMMREV